MAQRSGTEPKHSQAQRRDRSTEPAEHTTTSTGETQTKPTGERREDRAQTSVEIHLCVLCPQLLQDDLAERSVQLEKVKRAGRDLVSTDEPPSLKAVDILCAAGQFLSNLRPLRLQTHVDMLDNEILTCFQMVWRRGLTPSLRPSLSGLSSCRQLWPSRSVSRKA